jgi:hypothetical protein
MNQLFDYIAIDPEIMEIHIRAALAFATRRDAITQVFVHKEVDLYNQMRYYSGKDESLE